MTSLLVRNQRLALETKSLSQTFSEVSGLKATTPSLWRANSRENGSPSPGSWKPFLTAAEGGGGGGGAAEPGRSGGSGGRGPPPLWLSSPAREGSWGVLGKALEVLPFLLMGGGGGSGPRARQEASIQMLLTPGVTLPVESHCWLSQGLLLTKKVGLGPLAPTGNGPQHFPALQGSLGIWC